MKRSGLFIIVCVFFSLFFMGAASAKIPPKIESVVTATYPPPVHTKAIDTAHYDLNMESLNGFVVLEQGGIPAERARFFIEWQEYDYRGVVVNLEKNGKVTTRRGKPYCFLRKGDVLAVAGIKIFNRTVYLKLITPKVYIPEVRKTEKRHSRVTVMLGVKFPKEAFKTDDAKLVIDEMEKWVKPFRKYDAAVAYSSAVGAEAAMATAKTKMEEEEKTFKNIKTTDVAREKKIEGLEAKIEAARQDMEEAERDMEEIKEQLRNQ